MFIGWNVDVIVFVEVSVVVCLSRVFFFLWRALSEIFKKDPSGRGKILGRERNEIYKSQG